MGRPERAVAPGSRSQEVDPPRRGRAPPGAFRSTHPSRTSFPIVSRRRIRIRTREPASSVAGMAEARGAPMK